MIILQYVFRFWTFAKIQVCAVQIALQYWSHRQSMDDVDNSTAMICGNSESLREQGQDFTYLLSSKATKVLQFYTLYKVTSIKRQYFCLKLKLHKSSGYPMFINLSSKQIPVFLNLLRNYSKCNTLWSCAINDIAYLSHFIVRRNSNF